MLLAREMARMVNFRQNFLMGRTGVRGMDRIGCKEIIQEAIAGIQVSDCGDVELR